MKKIKLGDKVKCKITGFKGVTIARIEYINGCIQYEIVPKVKKGEKYPEGINLDEGCLEVLKKKKPKVIKKPNGGPPTMAFKIGRVRQ